MTFFQYLVACSFGIALAVGQILFKVAADQRAPGGETLPFIQIAFSWPMIAACIIYALTIILYVFLLQQIPLSRAYLFSMAGSAIVPLLAIVIFKEDFSVKYIIGVLFVISGVAISTTS